MSERFAGPQNVLAFPTSTAHNDEPTAHQAIDRVLDRLDRHKHDWVRVPIDRRAVLLRICTEGVLDVAEEWVRLGCAAKGVAPDSAAVGEEWISGPMVTLRYLRLLSDALDHDAQPRPRAMRRGPNGQTVARVFPYDAFDRLLYSGIRADVWITPGQLPTQGRIYADRRAARPARGRVGLVLGAGNVASIVPTDLLYKMFVEDQVVLVKMNPVNAYLGPLLRRAFRCLVDAGFLEFVYGEAEIGSYVCRHDRVETIHLTGSEATYDAIVWGATPAERKRRKTSGAPLLGKPFTAELGCVSPVLVVPGRWRSEEIEFQARNVASMVAHNASFNCNAAKLLVLPSQWKQRGDFLDAVKRAMATAPPRRAYYPGAEQRYRAFLEHYPQAQRLGARGAGIVPWTLIQDVAPRRGEYALGTEAFCGVLAEVTLDAGRIGDPAAFLAGAAKFVNGSVRGSLSCTVLVSDATREVLGAGLEHAVSALRYGGVGINVWPGVLFGLGVTTWGAFPGNTRAEIGSGVGIVHNSLLFDHAERSVAWAPSITRPKPPWFADHRNLPDLGRRITRFEAAPSWSELPLLGLSALRG
jgi:acyl-CoA reductase-like NAD-dependent aldehyde dehydrogenase